MSNTKTIAKNTGWFGLENAIDATLTMVTSILIARTLGPAKMGYIIYVTWISSVVGSLGGLGISGMTRKYMAEYIGKGDKGTARHIYIRTTLMQAALATMATVGLIFWVLRDASADYRLACVLVVLSIWPSMVNSIASSANVAAEQLSKNLAGSAASVLSYFLMILATVVFHWGVVGVGASMLVMRLADFGVRVIPTSARILAWDSNYVEPEGLGRRMFQFMWQSVAVMIVEMIVWQRSEFYC